MLSFKLVTFFCLVTYTYQKSSPKDDSYVAAVVEYKVNFETEVNVRQYESFIRQAAQKNADVIVFPELTLARNGISIPVPIHGKLKHNAPADHSELFHQVLVSISKAARANQIYVLINIQEKMNCTTANREEYCPEKKTYIFNTNVVFDRNGYVIDRYRKIHLFGEYGRSPALQPDLGVFTTDFGVTFGHFICFDLMFQVPAIQVVERMNITDVLFSTMWFSELPYLTAVQIQEAYAYSMNINFIASGANNVNVGSAGSGIYSGKQGALISTMPGLSETKLYVAKVPKAPGTAKWTVPGPQYRGTDHASLKLLSDQSISSHVTRLLVPGYQEFTLVDKEVTCRFRIRFKYTGKGSFPRFRAFMHDGSNTYAKQQLGTMSCSIVACKDETIASCPYRYNSQNSNTVIEELEIFMTSPRRHTNTSLQCDDVLYFPSSLRTNLFPIEPANFTYIENAIHIEDREKKSREHIIYKINVPQNDLISFNIWGRIYTRDVDHSAKVTEKEKQTFTDFENSIFEIMSNDEKNEI